MIDTHRLITSVSNYYFSRKLAYKLTKDLMYLLTQATQEKNIRHWNSITGAK